MRRMARALFWNDTRVRIGWPWTLHAGAGDGRLDPDAAAELLRAFRRTPAAMDTLRDVLGDELSGYRVARLSDDRVIDELSWRVRTGWLAVTVGRFGLRLPTAGVEVVSEAPPAPPPPSSSSARSAPPPAAPLQTDPDCTAGFQSAADHGTPLVERDADCM